MVLSVFLRQWQSPFVYLFVLAGIATWYVGDYTDAIIIAVAVVFNIALGFFQEYKAERVLKSLEKLLAHSGLVKRNGEWVEVGVDEIVVGDTLRLLIGTRVAADGVLMVEDGLFVDESVLTGESVMVEKKNFVGEVNSLKKIDDVPAEYAIYSGSVVEKGIGEILVLAVGKESKMGKIASLTSRELNQKTPLQAKIGKLSTQISVLVLALCLMIVLLGVWREREWVEMLPVAIAVAVSAIPEGLLVAQTLILVLAMKRIVARKAVVRNLMSAETLGSVEVICLDKTGTITVGKMQAMGAVIAAEGKVLENYGKKEGTKERLLAMGCVLCNDERDPLEFAMSDWAKKIDEKIGASWERVDELPFDHKYRYIVTRHKRDKIGIEYLSGAPEVVMNLCNLDKKATEAWRQKLISLGKEGYRLVAFAVKKLKSVSKGKIKRESIKDFDFLGVVVFVDPAREGVEDSLLKAQEAGLNVKIITGDYKETAWAAMQQVGLVSDQPTESEVLLGSEMVGLTSEELTEKVARAKLFARTSPEQKLAIVECLQMTGKVVAMTGDGVNDAPALKRADVGIVVSKASDVAREAGDLILLDDDFSVILEAIEAGRDAWIKLRRVSMFLLADAFSTLVLVMGGLIFDWPMPILASYILFTNLISDGVPYLGLVFDTKNKGMLKLKPIGRSEPLINREMFLVILFLSLLIGGLGLAVFGAVGMGMGYILKARTMIFVLIMMAPLLFGVIVKNMGEVGRGLWDNKFLTISLIVGLVGSVVATTTLAPYLGLMWLNGFDWLVLLWIGALVSYCMVWGVRFMVK